MLKEIRILLSYLAFVFMVLMVSQTLDGEAATTQLYADDFDDGSGGSTAHAGSDGSLEWGDHWSGSTSNGVWVQQMTNWCASGYCLRLLATDSRPQVISARSANLAGATTVTLSFDHRIFKTDSSGVVEISADGTTYNTLSTLNAESSVTSETFSIASGYFSADFHLRFRVEGDSWTDLYIDNLQLTVDGSTAPPTETPPTTGTPPTTTGTPSPTSTPATTGTRSAGCGDAASSGHGYEQIWSSGQSRNYYLSVPTGYDSNEAHNLVFGYHGVNYDGIRMRNYLRLEATDEAANTIFVYPDGLNRAWPEFGSGYSAIGWLTGQLASNEDFIFFDDMLAEVFDTYCIDTTRIYVTGQSWGGDMASSITCARGNDIAAATAVAANGDFFFTGYPNYLHKYPAINYADCQRAVPMITYRGAGDRYKTGKTSDWWYGVNQCQEPAGNAFKEQITTNGRYEDVGCTVPNIYVRYANTSPYMNGNDHDIPITFETETMNFFLQHTLPSNEIPTHVQMQRSATQSARLIIVQLIAVALLGGLTWIMLSIKRRERVVERKFDETG